MTNPNTPAAPALTNDDVGQLEYRGNSVSFIHSKMTAYRKGLDDAWQALREAGTQPDGKTSVADAIGRLAAPAITQPAEPKTFIRERAQLEQEWCELRAERAAYSDQRAEIDRLRLALTNLVQINEAHDQACREIIGRPAGYEDAYLNEARAALTAGDELVNVKNGGAG